MDPDNLPALANLVRTLGRSGSPEAEKYKRQLHSLEQRRQITDQVQQLSNFGLEAAKSGDWPEAVSQLEHAIQLCGQCAELAVLRKNIGLIYLRKGDINNGVKQLELALALLPQGPDATLVAETLRNVTSRSTLPSPAH
jgi:tetratricopeptide (TPR) repeat protein